MSSSSSSSAAAALAAAAAVAAAAAAVARRARRGALDCRQRCAQAGGDDVHSCRKRLARHAA